jgi:hypothetical protein
MTFYNIRLGCMKNRRPGNSEQAEPQRATSRLRIRLSARGIQDYSVCTGGKIKVTRCAHAPESQLQPMPDLFNNDPSAGSPTETLLRLLLPLNDQV